MTHTIKSKLHKSEGCKRVLEVQVAQTRLDEKLGELITSASRHASLPGFRRGKVPKDLIKSHYGAQLKDEAVKDLISSSFREAAKEHSLDFVSMPEVTDVVVEDGKGLRFKAQLEIRPAVKLSSYKGLKIKKAKAEVKDEEIDKVVNYLRESSAEFISAGDRPAQRGDYIICDIETTLEGKPVEKKDKLWMHLDETQSEPQFVNGMIGVKAKETRVIEVSYPQDHKDEKLKGKKAQFKVVVSEIKEKKLPDLDDEFAKDMGTYKSLDELKCAIRKDLEERALAKSNSDMKNELLNKLVSEAKFDVPESLLEAQAKRLEERSIENMKTHNVKESQIEVMDAELKKRCKEEASKSLKGFFILEKVAEAEGIKVTEDELGLRLEGFAQRHRKTKDEMRSELEEKGLLDGVMIEIKEEKVLEFLLKHARVEEGG